MNVLTDAVEIANAALAEVGLPQVLHWDANGMRIMTPWNSASPEVHRAILLGRLATSGPDRTTRCVNCWVQRLDRCTTCTTVGEALRGFTCGAS